MALPMALVLLVAASLIVVPSLLAVQSLVTINSNVSKDTMAYYAADAGIADLVWKYKYSTAPTSSYTLNNVDGMNVDVSLVKTSGQDYYWVSSAPSGTASKAQVYVHVRQTGSQGNNVFDQAVASLGGDITLSGGLDCLVTSDDVLVIDHCNDSWTRIAHKGDITCDTDDNIKEQTQYYDDGNSSKFAIKKSAIVEDLAYHDVGTDNISGYEYISLWVYSPSRSFNAGDLQLIIATANAVKGTRELLDLPLIPKGTNGNGTRISLTINNPANFGALHSIGIRQAIDVISTDTNLYIDEVIATNNLSKDPPNTPNNGNIYANGNLNLSGGTVDGNASATGSVTVNQWNAKLWGTKTSGASPFVPQAINIDQYKNEANIKGGTVYPTLNTAWNTSDLGQITVNGNANINWSSYNITMGPAWIGGNLNISTNTITMGPTYVVGDMAVSGSSKVTLKGTVYVGGKLVISGSALVQGPYTIVAKSIEVTGDSGVQIAKGNVPFIIAYNGDFKISGSSQIAAVIYAPNGTAYISGGTPDDTGYNVYGAVVAKSVVMSGSTTVKYMTGIQTLPWPPGWGLGGGPAGGGGTPETTVVGYDYR